MMVSAVILSGGQSTRMGQEKGLMPFLGRRLIEFVVETLDPISEEIIVSVAPGKTGIYERVLGPGLRLIEDRASGLGPMEGLITSLRAAKSDYVIVSPCDAPLLNRSVCGLMISTAVDRDGAIPRVRGYLEPLHAVYARKPGLDAFERTLASGERKLIEALKDLDLGEVDEDSLRDVDPQLDSFWNLNAPEDIASAEKRMLAIARRK